MLNQYVAGMLLAGLVITSVRAEYIPYSAEQQEPPMSRYEQVESYAWEQYTPPPDLFESGAEAPYDFAQPATASCEQLSLLNSQCVVNNPATREALMNQIRYLKQYPAYRRFATQGSNLSGQQLLSTATGVLRWLDSGERLSERFELVNLSPYGGESKAKFTGYYTPEIAASRYYTPEYRFPVYRNPGAARAGLSRAEINSGALEGLGLEIAWVKDPVDLFYIHLQGSGVLLFADGTRKVLQYSGSNGLPFKSIASYMQRKGYLNGDLSRRAITAWLRQHPETLGEVLAANPRYVFFKLGDDMASTASGMKLTPGHTVAVDTRFIPFGAVLLAEVPRLDAQGHVLDYEWRLLFPQDRGNAIKGSSRLDFYTGTGEMARRWANHVTGLRRAYLLLDREQAYVQTASLK